MCRFVQLGASARTKFGSKRRWFISRSSESKSGHLGGEVRAVQLPLVRCQPTEQHLRWRHTNTAELVDRLSQLVGPACSSQAADNSPIADVERCGDAASKTKGNMRHPPTDMQTRGFPDLLRLLGQLGLDVHLAPAQQVRRDEVPQHHRTLIRRRHLDTNRRCSADSWRMTRIGACQNHA